MSSFERGGRVYEKTSEVLPYLYVVVRILAAIRDSANTRSKTATAARLSYDKFLQYLELLKERGTEKVLWRSPPG